MAEIAKFSGDKATYIRVHIIMAVVGAGLLTGLLVLMGNPDWWVGIVGSFAGIAMRGYYIASEQLGFEWALTDKALLAPNERNIALSEIETARSLMGSVQVITTGGEKFLIKYQAEPEVVIAEINRAIANAR